MAQDEATIAIDSDLRASGEALFKNLGMNFDPDAGYGPDAPVDLEELRADYKAGRIKSIPPEDVRREVSLACANCQ